MITPEEYLNHNYNVIPCYENDKRPKGADDRDWETNSNRNLFLYLLQFLKGLCFD